MSLDKATVLHIAQLARISLREEELEGAADELSGILAWVEQLQRVETENVAPMASVVEMRLFWREDEVTEGGNPRAILENAPERDDGFFVVPKVVE